MKTRLHSALLAGVCGLLALAPIGCSTLTNIANSVANLKKLQFKLGTVNNFQLNGIGISSLSQPSQIPVTDYTRLAYAISQKHLPVSFTLNVLAKNPNAALTSTTGTSTAAPTLSIKRMDWTLLIDDRTTINGVVSSPVSVPGNGQTVSIPFSMNLDLYQFFADKGLDDLLHLAFLVGGVSGSSSHLKLTAGVTIGTPWGQELTYPGRLTIIDKDFTNQ